MTDQERAERLDALNEAAFTEQHRNIMDRGVSGPESALHRPYRPGGLSLLAQLRANAEAVYGGGEQPKRAPKTS